MADNSERIAAIRKILRAGARRVAVDGMTVEYDFDHLRRELNQLIKDDDYETVLRPTISTVDLTGF